jgi:hypothetical protein
MYIRGFHARNYMNHRARHALHTTSTDSSGSAFTLITSSVLMLGPRGGDTISITPHAQREAIFSRSEMSTFRSSATVDLELR